MKSDLLNIESYFIFLVKVSMTLENSNLPLTDSVLGVDIALTAVWKVNGKKGGAFITKTRSLCEVNHGFQTILTVAAEFFCFFFYTSALLPKGFTVEQVASFKIAVGNMWCGMHLFAL